MNLTSRQKRIAIFVVCFCSVLFSLLAYNLVDYFERLEKYKACSDETGCVLFYGDIEEEIYVPYEDLISSRYDRVEDKEFFQINRFSTEYYVVFSGVSLWNMMVAIDIFPEDADVSSIYIQFEATDGYKSFILPLRIAKENPEDVLIVTHEDGKTIPSKEQGGKGPLRCVVSLDVIEDDLEMQEIFADSGSDFVYNTGYSVHYVSAVNVMEMEGV